MTHRLSQATITDSVFDADYGVVLPVSNDDDTRHWQRFYVTPYGYVEMESRRWTHSADTWLGFVWAGRQHMRHFDRFYSKAWAVRLAREFVEDVVRGKVQP